MSADWRDEWCEDEDGNVWRWPFCTIPGCPNRICIGRSDRFCWPHSDSGTTVEGMIQKLSRKRKKARQPA